MKVTSKVEEEHTLKVKMPQGSTERTKKLIAKQKQTAAAVAGGQNIVSYFLVTHVIFTVFPLSQSTNNKRSKQKS